MVKTTRSASNVPSQKGPPPLLSRDTQATPDKSVAGCQSERRSVGVLIARQGCGRSPRTAHKRLLEEETALQESATAAERTTDSAAAATHEEANWHDADGEAKRHREEARSAALVGTMNPRSGAGVAEAQAADGGAAMGCVSSPRLASKPSRSYLYAVQPYVRRQGTKCDLVQISFRNALAR